MRETQKNVTVGDNTYIIRKMNAMEGAYFAVFATSKLIPAFQGIQSIMGAMAPKKKGAKDADPAVVMEKALGPIMEALKSLDKKDVDSLITTCMRHASLVLPAGAQPIMDAAGNWGVADIEYDLVLCLTLCYHVIRFNIEGFFGEGSLASFLAPRSTLQ